jgi:thioredoxin-like negative regulator of GroEL
MYARLICIGLLMLLASCNKSQPTHAQHASHANEPRDIAWFDGSLEGAFVVAKRESRPVLLYWGAEWCPFCHTLKSTVFSRADFIAKSHLFLPVYLDGDDDGAQKWGEQFGIQGYPTLIVLDPEQHEIIRLGAGRDVSQYAAALDLALDNLQPADVLLQTAGGGKVLNTQECRRLAYNSWETDTLEAGGYAARAEQLQAASAQCPAELTPERAILTIYAAFYGANAERDELDAPKAQPSTHLATLIDDVDAILRQPELAVSSAEALQVLDEAFFRAVRASGAKASPLRDRYVGIMDAAATDKRYVLADQLGFLDAKLRALKALNDAKYRLPKEMVAAIDARIDDALATEQNQYVRSGLVNASLNILEDLGDYPKAYDIAKAEIARSSTPYYYQGDLAEIAEKQGHRDEAIQLLDQAYRGSQGPATRFQWGQIYMSGLLRMTPKDSARIQDTGSTVLAELDGPDRIYRRARVRLEKLDHELRAWNDASKGQYKGVLQNLHGRMQEICVKIPDKEPARASCDSFLKTA